MELPHVQTLLTLITFVGTATTLYSGKSDVIDLNPTTFTSRVVDSDDIWIVEFYAPWCGHCKSLAPEYSKAASALKGIVKVGGVNSDEHKSLGGEFQVRGFPTIKIFGLNKKSPSDYEGPRTAQGIIDAAFKELKKTVESRLGGRSSGGDSGKKKGNSQDVVELTDSNFKELVLESKDMWLVEFYAPWCGHCQRLAPHWEQAATELKGKVKLGALDSTKHTIISGKYKIQGFPTIKHFPAGPKEEPEEYDGGRTAGDIVTWALEKAASSAPPPEVLELTNESALKEACENNQLCIISILPQLLDCQSECRNNYINMLKKLGDKFKRNRWGWVWAQAMDQQELEDGLEIGGFGYPALAVLNFRKMKYSILRGSFSYDGINEFLKSVAVGRGSSIPIRGAKIPNIAKKDPWDGKDEELPLEEDIDLSDVDLEDSPTSRSEL